MRIALEITNVKVIKLFIIGARIIIMADDYGSFTGLTGQQGAQSVLDVF